MSVAAVTLQSGLPGSCLAWDALLVALTPLAMVEECGRERPGHLPASGGSEAIQTVKALYTLFSELKKEIERVLEGKKTHEFDWIY